MGSAELLQGHRGLKPPGLIWRFGSPAKRRRDVARVLAHIRKLSDNVGASASHVQSSPFSVMWDGLRIIIEDSPLAPCLSPDSTNNVDRGKASRQRDLLPLPSISRLPRQFHDYSEAALPESSNAAIGALNFLAADMKSSRFVPLAVASPTQAQENAK